jgi:hypothetical protein
LQCTPTVIFSLFSQLHYFRDTLSYLATLESATVLLLLALLEMAWFFVVFELLFCAGRYAGQCDAVEYQLVGTAPPLNILIIVDNNILNKQTENKYCVALTCLKNTLDFLRIWDNL